MKDLASTEPDRLFYRAVLKQHLATNKNSVDFPAFMPTTNDKYQLSVDSDSADACYSRRYHTNNNYIGAWAISGNECLSHRLKVVADPISDNESHCLVPFPPTKQERRIVATSLALYANKRGRLAPQ